LGVVLFLFLLLLLACFVDLILDLFGLGIVGHEGLHLVAGGVLGDLLTEGIGAWGLTWDLYEEDRGTKASQ